MIVCSCHAVTDREIREAVEAGARSTGEAQLATRAGTGCGGCRMAVRAVVSDALAGADESSILPLPIVRGDRFELERVAS